MPVPQPFPVQVQVPVPIKVTEKVEVKVPVPVKVKEPFLVRIPFPIPVPEPKKEQPPPPPVTTPFPPTPPPAFTRPPALIFHNYITEPEPKIFTVHPRDELRIPSHHHRGLGGGRGVPHENLDEFLDEDLKKDLRDGQRAFEEGPIDPPHTHVRSWQESGYRLKLNRGPVIPTSLVKPDPIDYSHGRHGGHHIASAADNRPVKSFCCRKK